MPPIASQLIAGLGESWEEKAEGDGMHDYDIRSKIGLRIKELRAERGVSQEAVSYTHLDVYKRQRAQVVLAHGDGAAHLRAILGLRVVERVEALAVHRVAAGLVPAFFVDVSVAVALVSLSLIHISA